MARATQKITSAYAGIVKPSDVFTQINLAPNKSEGVTSYDNAEMVETLTDVYHYAQQQSSLLMPLFVQKDMTAMFHSQDTFNKVQWVQKTEEAPFTPLYVPSGGTRCYTMLQYHQAIQISPTIARLRRYELTPNYQMELANALGRLYDLGILWAITQAVLKKTSTASANFQGVPTVAVENMPAANHWLMANAGGTTASSITTDGVDELVNALELRDLDPMNCWVIGGPRLRLALKKTPDFRNRERTIAFNGNEQSRYFEWNGLRFCILQSETYPKNSLAPATALKFPNGGGFALSSGGAVPTGIGNFAVVVDLSAITWGTAPFAERAFSSFRDDISYTMQFYSEVGFGGMRIDDNKVVLVHFK